MIKVDYIVSDNQRDALAAPVDRALGAAPHWLRELTLRYDPGMDEGILLIRISEEYRCAGVRVSDAYFADTEHQRWLAPIHEISHLHYRRLSDVFQSLLRAATNEDDPLRKWADEEWRRAEEASVCDLAEVLDKILPHEEADD